MPEIRERLRDIEGGSYWCRRPDSASRNQNNERKPDLVRGSLSGLLIGLSIDGEKDSWEQGGRQRNARVEQASI